ERAAGQSDRTGVVDSGAVAGEGDSGGYVDVGGIADAFAGEEIVVDVEGTVVDQLAVEAAGVVGECSVVGEEAAEDAIVEGEGAGVCTIQLERSRAPLDQHAVADGGGDDHLRRKGISGNIEDPALAVEVQLSGDA